MDVLSYQKRLVRCMVVNYDCGGLNIYFQIVINLLHEYHKLLLIGRVTSHEDRFNQAVAYRPKNCHTLKSSVPLDTINLYILLSPGLLLFHP